MLCPLRSHGRDDKTAFNLSRASLGFTSSAYSLDKELLIGTRCCRNDCHHACVLCEDGTLPGTHHYSLTPWHLLYVDSTSFKSPVSRSYTSPTNLVPGLIKGDARRVARSARTLSSGLEPFLAGLCYIEAVWTYPFGISPQSYCLIFSS